MPAHSSFHLRWYRDVLCHDAMIIWRMFTICQQAEGPEALWICCQPTIIGTERLDSPAFTISGCFSNINFISKWSAFGSVPDVYERVLCEVYVVWRSFRSRRIIYYVDVELFTFARTKIFIYPIRNFVRRFQQTLIWRTFLAGFNFQKHRWLKMHYVFQVGQTIECWTIE